MDSHDCDLPRITTTRRDAANDEATKRVSPPLRCKVEQCGIDLKSAPKTHQRFRLCNTHIKAPVVVVDGVHSRFCQQCSRFHPVDEFNGTNRTCRMMLAKNRARQRTTTTGPSSVGRSAFGRRSIQSDEEDEDLSDLSDSSSDERGGAGTRRGGKAGGAGNRASSSGKAASGGNKGGGATAASAAAMGTAAVNSQPLGMQPPTLLKRLSATGGGDWGGSGNTAGGFGAPGLGVSLGASVVGGVGLSGTSPIAGAQLDGAPAALLGQGHQGPAPMELGAGGPSQQARQGHHALLGHLGLGDGTGCAAGGGSSMFARSSAPPEFGAGHTVAVVWNEMGVHRTQHEHLQQPLHYREAHLEEQLLQQQQQQDRYQMQQALHQQQQQQREREHMQRQLEQQQHQSQQLMSGNAGYMQQASYSGGQAQGGFGGSAGVSASRYGAGGPSQGYGGQSSLPYPQPQQQYGAHASLHGQGYPSPFSARAGVAVAAGASASGSPHVAEYHRPVSVTAVVGGGGGHGSGTAPFLGRAAAHGADNTHSRDGGAGGGGGGSMFARMSAPVSGTSPLLRSMGARGPGGVSGGGAGGPQAVAAALLGHNSLAGSLSRIESIKRRRSGDGMGVAEEQRLLEDEGAPSPAIRHCSSSGVRDTVLDGTLPAVGSTGSGLGSGSALQRTSLLQQQQQQLLLQQQQQQQQQQQRAATTGGTRFPMDMRPSPGVGSGPSSGTGIEAPGFRGGATVDPRAVASPKDAALDAALTALGAQQQALVQQQQHQRELQAMLHQQQQQLLQHLIHEQDGGAGQPEPANSGASAGSNDSPAAYGAMPSMGVVMQSVAAAAAAGEELRTVALRRSHHQRNASGGSVSFGHAAAAALAQRGSGATTPSAPLTMMGASGHRPMTPRCEAAACLGALALGDGGGSGPGSAGPGSAGPGSAGPSSANVIQPTANVVAAPAGMDQDAGLAALAAQWWHEAEENNLHQAQAMQQAQRYSGMQHIKAEPGDAGASNVGSGDLAGPTGAVAGGMQHHPGHGGSMVTPVPGVGGDGSTAAGNAFMCSPADMLDRGSDGSSGVGSGRSHHAATMAPGMTGGAHGVGLGAGPHGQGGAAGLYQGGGGGVLGAGRGDGEYLRGTRSEPGWGTLPGAQQYQQQQQQQQQLLLYGQGQLQQQLQQQQQGGGGPRSQQQHLRNPMLRASSPLGPGGPSFARSSGGNVAPGLSLAPAQQKWGPQQPSDGASGMADGPGSTGPDDKKAVGEETEEQLQLLLCDLFGGQGCAEGPRGQRMAAAQAAQRHAAGELQPQQHQLQPTEDLPEQELQQLSIARERQQQLWADLQALQAQHEQLQQALLAGEAAGTHDPQLVTLLQQQSAALETQRVQAAAGEEMLHRMEAEIMAGARQRHQHRQQQHCGGADSMQWAQQ
ncbi:hypothetical protein HYH02_012140 [Chlamydomonas schloesseri]|uniref:SBP-type domain-containing protein n=1 Tax=Chlamydomonas schloesseri TaxID=2026947 RepID=A0A835T6Y8_9CHLO|nr:hypothetical protein HYH02_012140 [Chlamydomonas schloesseri]|eukprot:KAG2434944.1 hypothetical protein HYH02_012140 [Chlamydomonas schloesseri]